MQQTEQAPPDWLRWFRLLALAEGASFLTLLGIAMPLKYLAGFPLAVQIVGLIHGMLFLAYVAAGPSVFVTLNWPLARVPGFLAAAVLPFGTFVLERKWLRAAVERT